MLTAPSGVELAFMDIEHGLVCERKKSASKSMRDEVVRLDSLFLRRL